MISERRSSTRGVSLVETIVSLAVVGFGFLALAGMQLNLYRHADSSHQRATAARLAHEKLEQMRGVERLEGDGSRLAWNDLVSGDDEPLLDGGSFVRQWKVAGESTDGQRMTSVTVSWGGQSAVTLATVLARSDPIDGAGLAVPPPGGVVRRLRQRHVSIPLQASPLAGVNRGKSSLAWPDGGYLVFDNMDGSVVARCATEPDDGIDLRTQCTAVNASMLEGYISGVDPQNPVAVRFQRNRDTPAARDSECFVERTGRGGDLAASVYRYRCLIAAGESGSLQFSGLPAGVSVCRYLAASRDAIFEKYTRAAKPAERQNFLVSAATDCPDNTAPYTGD